MKIGFISQWYDPEGGSAAVPGYVARSLQALGLEVTVLTGFPNYPDGVIYPGYRQRLHFQELRDGIEIHRFPLFPDHTQRISSRVVSNLSFAVSSLLGMWTLRKVDAYLVYSTPVSVGFAVAVMSFFRPKPTVTFVQDLWPDTLVASGFLDRGRAARILFRLVQQLSDWIYRRSDIIAVISPGMKSALAERGVDPARLHLVPNWIPNDVIPRQRAAPASKWRNRHSFRVVYAGNFGRAQAVQNIIEAAALLRHRADIEFTLIGSGVMDQTLRDLCHTYQLTNVAFIGQQPNSLIPDLIAESDCQLITLADSPLLRITTPSKLQYSLAFGRPIVAAVGGDAAQIIEESGGGIVVPSDNPLKLANAIETIADLPEAMRASMSEAAREFFATHFSEAVGPQRLARLLYEAVVRGD